MTEEKKGPGRPKKEESVEPKTESKASLSVGMESKDGMWKIAGQKEVQEGTDGTSTTYWVMEPTEENTKFLGKTPMKEEDAAKLMAGEFNHVR